MTYMSKTILTTGILLIFLFFISKTHAESCITMKMVDWSVFSSSNLTCSWFSNGNISLQLHIHNETVDVDSCAKFCKEMNDAGNECQGFIYNTNTSNSDGNNCALCKTGSSSPGSRKKRDTASYGLPGGLSFYFIGQKDQVKERVLIPEEKKKPKDYSTVMKSKSELYGTATITKVISDQTVVGKTTSDVTGMTANKSPSPGVPNNFGV